MTLSVWEKLEEYPLFDSAMVEHHFTPYLRDYDIVFDVLAAIPGGNGSYIAARYLCRFTHCVVVQVITAVSDQAWQMSWSDIFTDYQVWEQSGSPSGYVWGVEFSAVYPGLKFMKDSAHAKEWTERLQQPMYELLIETNGHNITLIFHDVFVHQIATGDPTSGTLIPLD
jgi:hypothetical protein